MSKRRAGKKKKRTTNRRFPDRPPPSPGEVIAFLRWMVTFWKAQKSRPRASTPSAQSTKHITRGGESIATVVIAMSTDLAMLAAKVCAAVLTGSMVLFAESLHSLADTGNQVLLLNGLRRARLPADLRHPFGYGSEVFYWSLLAALSIFIVGGVLSIWEGVQHLLHPSNVQASLLGFAVIGFGCILDGTSWFVSIRQLRREAKSRGIPIKVHLRSTTDTAVTAVFYEDTGALIGDAVALVGLGVMQVSGLQAADAVAGIVIGSVLAAIGVRLAGRNRHLLTNRSDSPLVLDRIRQMLAAVPQVAAVGRIASIYVGPHQLLVLVEIQPVNALSGFRLRQLIVELRAKVRNAIPRAKDVFLMPVIAVEKDPQLTPWDRDYWLRRFPDDEQA